MSPIRIICLFLRIGSLSSLVSRASWLKARNRRQQQHRTGGTRECAILGLHHTAIVLELDMAVSNGHRRQALRDIPVGTPSRLDVSQEQALVTLTEQAAGAFGTLRIHVSGRLSPTLSARQIRQALRAKGSGIETWLGRHCTCRRGRAPSGQRPVRPLEDHDHDLTRPAASSPEAIDFVEPL